MAKGKNGTRAVVEKSGNKTTFYCGKNGKEKAEKAKAIGPEKAKAIGPEKVTDKGAEKRNKGESNG